jgi:antibiotic biosynthesis monooxygenase
MQIAYALEPNLSVQAFRDILIASTLAEPVERFESLTEPGKLLSLSFWRDEQAVKAWRTQTRHRDGQVKGRGGIFAEYRLRVASVLRDYGLNERAEVRADSKALHGA